MTEQYNFNIGFLVPSGRWEVGVDTAAAYGFFEDQVNGTGGGLWFERKGYELELIDYDGVEVLPSSIIRGLRERGLIVGEEFE